MQTKRSQVVEAALTTALTDRAYSPLAFYAGAPPSRRIGNGGGGSHEFVGAGDRSNILRQRRRNPYGGGGGGSAAVGAGVGGESSTEEMESEEWRRARETEYSLEDEAGLAEVDFRQQYDDFA